MNMNPVIKGQLHSCEYIYMVPRNATEEKCNAMLITNITLNCNFDVQLDIEITLISLG